MRKHKTPARQPLSLCPIHQYASPQFCQHFKYLTCQINSTFNFRTAVQLLSEMSRLPRYTNSVTHSTVLVRNVIVSLMSGGFLSQAVTFVFAVFTCKPNLALPRCRLLTSICSPFFVSGNRSESSANLRSLIFVLCISLLFSFLHTQLLPLLLFSRAMDSNGEIGSP